MEAMWVEGRGGRGVPSVKVLDMAVALKDSEGEAATWSCSVQGDKRKE